MRPRAEEFSCEGGGFPTLLVDRDKGRPVRRLELRAADGRLLGNGDTEVKASADMKRRKHAPA